MNPAVEQHHAEPSNGEKQAIVLLVVQNPSLYISRQNGRLVRVHQRGFIEIPRGIVNLADRAPLVGLGRGVTLTHSLDQLEQRATIRSHALRVLNYLIR